MIPKLKKKQLNHLLILLVSSLVMFTGCKKNGADPAPSTVSTVSTQNAATAFDLNETGTVETDRNRLATNMRLTDFTPTGLYLAPGGTLTVKVEQVSGTRLPSLLVGTYSRYRGWNDQPAIVQLKAGDNIISDASLKGYGGLLWIRYTNDAADAKAKVTFVSGFKPVPYYIAGKTTNAQWKSMLASMTDVPDVVLTGERNYLVVDRLNAIKYQDQDQDALLKKLASVIKIEDDLSGLDGSTDRDKPSIYKYLSTQHEDPSYYFFATDYRTAFIGSSIDAILTNSAVGVDGWGVWHELGHQHQQIWTWPAITEVTVNTFSLAVQRNFLPGQPTRLTKDGVWAKAKTYLANADADKDFNAYTNGKDAAGKDIYISKVPLTDVFVRLCLFDQLNLKYGAAFWPNFYKQTRMDKQSLNTADLKMEYFMLTACKISGNDLTNFFKKWGLRLSTQSATDAVFAKIAALNLPFPGSDPSLIQE